MVKRAKKRKHVLAKTKCSAVVVCKVATQGLSTQYPTCALKGKIRVASWIRNENVTIKTMHV